MNGDIKRFIEQNVDLLDKDPVEFFFRSWEASGILSISDVAYMSAMLSDAGIKDVEENRERALLKALDTQMEEFGLADGGVSAMPVYDFIQAYMDNCVGYNENYVLLFIQKHCDRWDSYIELYKENNMTIISRR
jgi:hypothetical protein